MRLSILERFCSVLSFKRYADLGRSQFVPNSKNRQFVPNSKNRHIVPSNNSSQIPKTGLTFAQPFSHCHQSSKTSQKTEYNFFTPRGFEYSLGQVLCALTSYLLSFSWRLQYTLLGISMFIYSLSFLIIAPESAAWLFSQKKYQECYKVLQWIAQTNGKNLQISSFPHMSHTTKQFEVLGVGEYPNFTKHWD